MIDSTFKTRVSGIEWSRYSTAYGSAEPVPGHLLELASDNAEVASHAGHKLWCELCHQDIYVSDAAIPALEFLLEILRFTDGDVAYEILEMLHTFARVAREHPQDSSLRSLRPGIRLELTRIIALSASSYEDAADSAQKLLKEIARSEGDAAA